MDKIDKHKKKLAKEVLICPECGETSQLGINFILGQRKCFKCGYVGRMAKVKKHAKKEGEKR